MKLAGIEKPSMTKSVKQKMMRSYALMALSSFVMAVVLAHELTYAGTYMNLSGLPLALQGAFWLWLGFIVPVTLNSVLWEGKSWKLWGIYSGYYLVSLAVMGAILTSWV
jgi:hypothetical protein